MASTRVRHAVTLWLSAAAVTAYLCRNSLVVAESELRTGLGLSEDQMGFILGPAFFWTYALAQIPTARWGERIGARRALASFSVVWSLASLLIAAATGFAWLLASRLISGVAQAGLFPGSVRVIADWHPRPERGTASGMLGAAMSVGGAIGAGLTGWLLGSISVFAIFAWFALPGLLWSVGFVWWFRERPADHPAVNDEELRRIRGEPETAAAAEANEPAAGPSPARPSGARPSGAGRPGTGTPDMEDAEAPLAPRRMWLELWTSPAAWLLFGQQFFRAGGYAFFASWFATYLMETRGVTTAQSGWMTAMPLIATVAGSMLGGVASDAVLRASGSLSLARKGVAATSLSLCAVLVATAFFVHDPLIAVGVISGGAFLAAIGGPCGYTMTMDLGGNHVASVFSTMNMLGNFGAGLTPWLVPRFKRWVEASPTGMAWSDGNSWNAVLLLFVAMYLGSAICWCLLSARGSVFEQSLLRRK